MWEGFGHEGGCLLLALKIEGTIDKGMWAASWCWDCSLPDSCREIGPQSYSHKELRSATKTCTWKRPQTSDLIFVTPDTLKFSLVSSEKRIKPRLPWTSNLLLIYDLLLWANKWCCFKMFLFTAAPRLPCPSLSPGVCSNSCPLSQWCYPTISSSTILFFPCPQSFPAWVSSSHQVAKVPEFQFLI